MYCKNCGKEIDDRADVCIYCGVRTGQGAAPSPTNTLAVVALILSFIVAPVGLILGILGLHFARKHGGSGKGIAVAAVTISAIPCVILVFMLLVLAIALG